MYAGEIVEMAAREEFFAAPQHPYTRKLFAALPGAARRGQQLADHPRQRAAAGPGVFRLPFRRSLRLCLGALPQ